MSEQRKKTLLVLLTLLFIAYVAGAFTVWAASNVVITTR